MDSKKGAKPKTSEKGFENTEENEHALENCIHTKWEAASIDWNGVDPYVW